jgi:undecaprenyl-diphosphatase
MGLLPAWFWQWWDTIVIWAASLGLVGLATVSFTEAIIQPVPPDPILLSMVSEANGDIPVIFVIWLVATLASVAGSVVAWWIGSKWGRPIIGRFASKSNLSRLDAIIERYGEAGVFIAALSPIPYKLLGWVAGMGRMDRSSFIAAGLLGRGLRFGIEALVIGVWGTEFWHLMEDPRAWLIVSLLGILLLFPAKKWWDGLLPDTPIPNPKIPAGASGEEE